MLVASWFFRVKHFPQRSRFPEVERDGCDNMISRKGRHAPQRYSRMLFFAALRGLGEPIFSHAKDAMRRKDIHACFSSRHFAGLASRFFLSQRTPCAAKIFTHAFLRGASRAWRADFFSRKGRNAPQRKPSRSWRDCPSTSAISSGVRLQHLDRILRNNGVIGNQRQAFDIRLRDDDPIKRVFM